MSNWLVALILSASLLNGCAQMTVMEPDSPLHGAHTQGLTPELLVASDLVNALVQVEGLHPEITHLQMLDPKLHQTPSFGNAIQEVLLAAGYKLEIVSSRTNERFVDYLVSKGVSSDNSSSKTFLLSVDQVHLKRDYLLEQGRLQPNSHLFARGFDASQLKLNDNIFAKAPRVDEGIDEAVAQSQSAGDSSVLVQDGLNPENTNPENTSTENVAQELASPGVPEQQYAALDLRVNGQSTPGRYEAGDNLEFTIKTEHDTQLSCYFRDADRTIMRVYPNRFSSAPILEAGQTLQLPSSEHWSIEASRSGFSDEVMCIEVGPELQSLAQFVETMPDFEPLPVVSFDELLAEVELATGLVPPTHRMVINVD